MTERATIGIVFTTHDGNRMAMVVRRSGVTANVTLPPGEFHQGQHVQIEQFGGAWRIVEKASA